MAESEVSLSSSADDLAHYMGTAEAHRAEMWQLQALALVRRLACRPLTDLEYGGLLRGFQGQ